MTKIVGYWYNDLHSVLPKPEAQESGWKGQPEWLAILTLLEIHLQAKWYRFLQEEKDWGAIREKQREQGIAVTPYFEDTTKPDFPPEVVTYRGSSRCRICDCRNGSWEYVFGGFTWPQGYIHYLSEHNVLPDPEFKQYVIDWAKENVVVAGVAWTIPPQLI